MVPSQLTTLHSQKKIVTLLIKFKCTQTETSQSHMNNMIVLYYEMNISLVHPICFTHHSCPRSKVNNYQGKQQQRLKQILAKSHRHSDTAVSRCRKGEPKHYITLLERKKTKTSYQTKTLTFSQIFLRIILKETISQQ